MKKIPSPPPPPPIWLTTAADLIKSFADKHKLILSKTERQLSASFEVGCLHALLNLYEKQGYDPTPQGLDKNSYKYLTSPSGNPANFSYVTLSGDDGEFELRQQVRIESHLASDIRFTPDIVVVEKGAQILGVTHNSYANGKRKFFSVKSEVVVAAHECKSMNPFPELMVSFIGMLVTAHKWHPDKTGIVSDKNGHIAPTLFVGGTARALHLKMIEAMQSVYMLNIVVGMHTGTWSLNQAKNRFKWKPIATSASSTSTQVISTTTTLQATQKRRMTIRPRTQKLTPPIK